MNFTWFASAYDTDDVAYRLATLVQLVGALVLAAGVPTAFETGDFTIPTVGYGITRVALIAQWLRAAHEDPQRRACSHRYAAGLAVVQTAWLLLLLMPFQARIPIIPALIAVELLIPAWAERRAPTQWHAGHIAERYGLLNIIVLGESILAASMAIRQVVVQGASLGDLMAPIIGGILILFSLWWLYFERPADELLTSLPVAFLWGYGHFFIVAAGAAVGAGLAVGFDFATHHAEISATAAGAATAIPVAVYLLVLWFLHQRPRSETPGRLWLTPFAVALVLLTPLTDHAILLTGIITAALLVTRILIRRA
jgi:low temperature requirement protein LtrA